MRPHPYLRAYMAGIVVPTIFLLVVVTVFATFRYVIEPTAIPPTLGWALSLERLGRAIIFPMAVVPNLWGVWNMTYLAVKRRAVIPFGAYGALLPLVLVPLGIMLDQMFSVVPIRAGLLLPLVVIVMIVYYLLWKHIVGFLNHEMGIA